MRQLTVDMLAASRDLLLRNSAAGPSSVFEIEETIDALQDAVDEYLDRINGKSLPPEAERRLHAFRHVVDDIERIGDHAVNIAGDVLLI